MAWSDPPRLIDGDDRASALLRAYARGTRAAQRPDRPSPGSWLRAFAVAVAVACVVATPLAPAHRARARTAFLRGAGGAEGTSGGARAAGRAGSLD